MSNAFIAVFTAADQAAATEQRLDQRKNEGQAALRARSDALRVEWLALVLNRVSIDAKVEGPSVVVEGFEFAIKNRNPYYFGLVKINQGSNHDPNNWRETDKERIEIVITNTHLAEVYRHPDPRPHRVGPIAQGVRYVQFDCHKADDALLWHPRAVKIGEAIRFLQQEAAEAPARLRAVIDWEAEQAEIERQRQAEQEKADLSRRERKAKEQAEAEARRQREDQLRAEVAAQFGVSPEAFDYLIEALADELRRREDSSWQ